MNRVDFICDGSENCRLDIYVSVKAEVTRSRAASLIETGGVTVNSQIKPKNYKLKCGDNVSVVFPKAVEYEAKPEDIPLDIMYEDDQLLVVNKPKGMVVHPAAGNYEGTLVNAIMHHCGDSLSGINGVMRPGIVHRIDKNTSGLLMVAKTDLAHNFLAQQIKEHSFLREYEAVLYGNLKNEIGVIDAPIGRHPVKRKQMAVTDKNSKNAVTHYRVIENFDKFTHVRFKLETGRTHQIRVHSAYIGHPVAGDDVYGPRAVIKELNGQCLHAKKLGFVHPNGKFLEFESELPQYFTEFIKKCKG